MKKTAKSFFALLTAFLLILPLFPVGIFDAAAEDGGIVVTIDDDPVEIIATLGEQDEEEEEAPEEIVEYDLWLGSARVTSLNKDDILNDGGRAKYDPSRQLLTLDDPVISDSHVYTNNRFDFTTRIYARGINLTIVGRYEDSLTDTDFSLRTDGILTLSGDFTFRAMTSAVKTEILVVKNGTLNCYTTDRFADAMEVSYKIYVFGGVERIYAESLDEPIHIVGVANYLDKVFLYGQQKVTEQSNPRATIIEPDETVYREYNLWVGNTRVTTDNMNDVLGDGKVRYEPGSDTLRLDEPTISDSVSFKFENATCTAKIRVLNMPLQIKGKYTMTEADADFAIVASGGDLTLDGEFTLYGNKNAVEHRCSYSDSYRLVVRGTLTANGGNNGIYAVPIADMNGCFDLHGGHTGLDTLTLYLSGSGTVTGGDGFGVYCSYDAFVDGDFSFDGNYCGIYLRYGSAALRGNITAHGKKNGIWQGGNLSGNVTLGRGTIVASGDEEAGFRIDAGNLILGNDIGTVTARGGLTAVHCWDVTYGEFGAVLYPENTGFSKENSRFYTQVSGTTMAACAKEVTLGRYIPLCVGNTLVHTLIADDVLGDGKVTFDPDTNVLTLNEPEISEPFSNDHLSAMIITWGADLTIKGKYTPGNKGTKYGVTGLKGKLTLDGEFDFYGSLCAICSQKDLTLKGKITGGGKYGVFTKKSVIVEGADTVVTLNCSSTALRATKGTLTLKDDLYIKTPERGSFSNGCVCNLSGGAVSAVTIKKTPHYGVWLGDVEVTGENYFDILGDGTAVYDPAASKLTLNEPAIPGTHCKSGGSGYDFTYRPAKIWADGVDLTIEGVYEIDDRDVSYGVAVTNGDLTLNGDFTFNTFHCGIACEGDLTLSGGKGVLIDLHYAGGTGILCGGEIVLHGGIERLRVEAPIMCCYGYTIINGLEDHLALTVPQGGRFFYEAQTVVDANNQQAKRVVFENDFILVEGHRCTALDANTTALSTGWYAVVGRVTNNNRLNVTGEVHLILDDYSVLNLKYGIHLTGNNSLAIYGGSKSGGTLQITAPPQYCAGIGGNYQESGGTLTVNGGILNITVGNEGGAVIGGGRSGAGGPVTINGGKLNLRSNSSGMCIGAGFMASYCPELTIGELSVTTPDGTVPLSQRVSACREEIVVHINPCETHAFTDHVCDYCGKTATVDDILSGSGSENDPYLISSTSDWEELGYFIENGSETAGLYFKQTENVSVTTSVGASGRPFKGVYDGNCKTLTVQLNNSPFASIESAVIRNLITEGTVNGGNHCSGLVCGCHGSSRIEGCAVRVSITTSGGYCGGFIGHAGTNEATIIGCVFDGGFTGATHAGTFWGWSDAGAEATVVDCVDLSDSAFPIGAGRNDPTDGVFNVFYTASGKTPDPTRSWTSTGRRVYRVEEGSTATLSFSGEVTGYAGSGLSFCGSTFSLGEEGVFFAPEGKTVSLYAAPANGALSADGYLADLDPFVNGALVMPSKNVTVNSYSGIPVTSYEDAESAAGNNGEGAENLFDGDFSTKWCVSGISSPFSVTFRTGTAVKPVGYLFTTAGDTAKYPRRNPTAWTLEGSADGTNWTTLADVSNDATLGGFNGKSYVFPLDGTEEAYTFFRFTVKGVGADSTTFQLAELRFFTSPRALCDVNCDGVVNVSDVTSLLNHLAIAVEYDAHYDMNGDSAVNITDVSALLDLLAGKN